MPIREIFFLKYYDAIVISVNEQVNLCTRAAGVTLPLPGVFVGNDTAYANACLISWMCLRQMPSKA
jgi:hypothetical protein